MTIPADQAGGGGTALARNSVAITAPTVLKHLERLSHEALSQHHDLSAYMSAAQRDPASLSSKYQEPRAGQTPFETFLSYLSSRDGSLLAEAIDQDLSYPLPNYFISSSHNTYLSGNQLSSNASATVYKDVLLRGCRCVEIDVWSGRDEENDQGGHLISAAPEKYHNLKDRIKGHLKSESKPHKTAPATAESSGATDSETLKRVEPRVLHGYTLTKEVPFREVCKAIRDNAFTTSDLPVIVSLEVHASLEQQQIMVEIIEEYWREFLLDDTSPSIRDTDNLPPPGDFKRKLLIKVKYTPPEKAKKDQEEDATGKPSQDSTADSSDEEEDDAKQSKPKKKKMLDALSNLGVYTRSYHFNSFKQPEASIASHVFSLSEGTVSEEYESSATALFKHNQDYFMRTYPKGSRISSSNLNPAPFWRQGVQIVALNWQKCDKGMMLNEGMFAETGGWVLKPENYRGRGKTGSSSSSTVPSPPSRPHTSSPMQPNSSFIDLSIDFLAAQNLPLHSQQDTDRSFHPYIRCTLHTETLGASPSSTLSSHGKPAKAASAPISGAAKIKLKGQTKSARGRSPDFGGERLLFSGVPVDDEALSFLRFKVLDDIGFRRDELAAWACLRLDRVREGVRLVHLFDGDGRETDGFVLLRIVKTVRRVGGGALPVR